MTYIAPALGIGFLVAFGLVMLAITCCFSKFQKTQNKLGFLLAGREVGWFRGGASIAASWIWAPALFISVQSAYQNGIAGIFWFTLPNALALMLFAILAPRIRKKYPNGFTLPQYIKNRLGGKRVHRIYVGAYLFYQLMAVSVQLFAGGGLVALLTGIPLGYVMIMLLVISLSYTLISGLRASVITDVVQIALLVSIGTAIVTYFTNTAGGLTAILAGLHGINGVSGILDPKVAFSFGIVTSIGLFAGAIADQQYWQRSFAIKQSQLKPAFIFGALLFAIVPIGLSILGFAAANPALGITLPSGVDPSLIGVQAVSVILPMWAVMLFILMLLSGLSSTLDSGLSAASSLWLTDVVKSSDKDAVNIARKAMIGISIVGLVVAFAAQQIPGFGLMHLWWVFNAAGACLFVPTLLSLYWDRLSEKGVFWGTFLAFILGLPLFVMANISGNNSYIVLTTLLIVGISTGGCVLMPRKKPA